MIYYFDTSALAKRYISETGTEQVQRLMSQAIYVETSIFTELELTAFFERAKRERRIDSPMYRKIGGYFASDIRAGVISLTNVDLSTWKNARRLIQQRRLRVGDAIQLAAALAAYKRFRGGLSYFVCADQALVSAAQLERLPCLNPLE